jgi:septum formation protein
MNPDPGSLLLASASPRRAALLRQIGLAFDVQPAALDERVLPGESPEAYVLRLARAKAAAVAAPGRITLGADTAVVCDGQILGKPADAADNLAMLARLSGRAHQVHTAIALQAEGRSHALGVVTEVWFRQLSEREMQAYAAQGEGSDKAGGYGIQGIGGVFVSRIRGSYSAVVGLPLAELEVLLVEAGVDTWHLRDHD